MKDYYNIILESIIRFRAVAPDICSACMGIILLRGDENEKKCDDQEARAILKAIRAGVGLGLGPRLEANISCGDHKTLEGYN